MLGLMSVLASGAVASDRERTNYLLHCSGCHQPDGSGSPDSGIPDMRGRVGHYLRLPEGRAYLVQVPGSAQSSLNDRDTATMLNWMVNALGGADVPADFLPFTQSEVTRLRAQPLDDVAGARMQVVKRLQSMGFSID